MENRDSTVNQSPNTPAPSATATTARAVLSGGVFGAVGWKIGEWLGNHGNAPKSEMARPIMKWGMGAFWALMAAYSSLKASEQEAKAERLLSELPPIPNASVAEPEQADKPVAQVDAAQAAYAGKATASPEMQRI